MPELFRLFSGKLFQFLKRIPPNFIIPIILFNFGVIFLGIGLIQYIFNFRARENLKKSNFTDSKSLSQLQNQDFTPSVITPQSKMLSIDVEGAVQGPGVYSVSLSARLQDALIASGGLNANADREWIGKNLNLAENVTDGMKIYIPRVGEQALYQSGTGQVAAAETGNSSLNISDPSNCPNPSNPPSLFADSQPTKKPPKEKSRKTSDTKTKKQKKVKKDSLGNQSQNTPVSINNASIEVLSTLPGVKSATAKKIISKRPYASLNDLLKKKAVSKKTFAKIKEKIRL